MQNTIFFCIGIINLLCDGLAYINTSRHFAHCSYFSSPLRNSQNIRTYYMLNHRIRCIYINLLITAFLMIFRRFPTTFRRFPKIFQNCTEDQTNVPEHFPRISENFLRCPRISEDCRRLSRKTRRCFDDTPTNLSTIRDKPDDTEIIDIFTCEDIISSHINNSRHLARKYARIFVRGHYLFREANSFPRAK